MMIGRIQQLGRKILEKNSGGWNCNSRYHSFIVRGGEVKKSAAAVKRPLTPALSGTSTSLPPLLSPFSTSSEPTPISPSHPLSGIRKQLWEFYLSTGRGAKALFEAIDVDENGKIDPTQLKSFMQEVLVDTDGNAMNPREIMPYAWNRLEQRSAAGQYYDMKSFKQWLIAATKMSADFKNMRMLEYLRQHPELGEQYSGNASKEGDFYTWNEESMSQSLRRMQYAVRGEVVMKADQLKAQGKDILYTNIGNPHQVGQSPIIFYRQVLALCDLPPECGVNHPDVQKMFPADVVERAKEMMELIGPSGTGAYTSSQVSSNSRF